MKNKISVILTVFILFCMAAACSQKQGENVVSSQAKPRNVIMILGDGMGPEQVGLLLTYAVRRTLDNGAPLGYLAEQLRLRFGATQPQAVRAVISAAKAKSQPPKI